jgi:hypothetical protein
MIIKLCKHLDDNGKCGLKELEPLLFERCPAVQCDLFGRLQKIDYELMTMMACSDKWSDVND